METNKIPENNRPNSLGKQAQQKAQEILETIVRPQIEKYEKSQKMSYKGTTNEPQ